MSDLQSHLNEIQTTLDDLTVEAALLRLCLEEQPRLSSLSPAHYQLLLRRLSDYISQHTMDLNALVPSALYPNKSSPPS